MKEREVLLEVKGISKTYESSPDAEILKGVDFEIYEGEFMSIMGRSGSGKSTLFYIMAVLDEPSRGAVYYDGCEMAKFDTEQIADIRNMEFGFIPQIFDNAPFQLLPVYSALDNVVFPMVFAGRDEKDCEESGKTLFALFIRG